MTTVSAKWTAAPSGTWAVWPCCSCSTTPWLSCPVRRCGTCRALNSCGSTLTPGPAAVRRAPYGSGSVRPMYRHLRSSVHLPPLAVVKTCAFFGKWTSLSAPCPTLAPLLGQPQPPLAPKPAGGSTKTSPSHPLKAFLRRHQRQWRLVFMVKALPQPLQWWSTSWVRRSWRCPNLTQKSIGPTMAMKTLASLFDALSSNVHLSLTCRHLPPHPHRPCPLY